MDWDHADRLRHAQVANGDDQHLYFTYDAGGQRVRKVHIHGTIVEERIYLGGYEIYRKRSTAPNAPIEDERQTLHVMDDQRRVALAETTTVEDFVPREPATTRWRFQLDNHLGSATLELDAAGNVISYEEYHPYGTTAFHVADGNAEVSAKRYRYTGKEKDEGTGLYYHGARYYAPWLGRWTACDPAGLVDGLNLYRYSRDNPVRYSDPGGTQSAEQPGDSAPKKRPETPAKPAPPQRAVAAVMFGGKTSDTQARNMDAFLRRNYGAPGAAKPTQFTEKGSNKVELRRTMTASGADPKDIVRDIGRAAAALKGDEAASKAVALVLHGNVGKIGREDPGQWVTEEMLAGIESYRSELSRLERKVKRGEEGLRDARKAGNEERIAKAKEALTDASQTVQDYKQDPRNAEVREFSEAFEEAAGALKEADVSTVELQACNTGEGGGGLGGSYGFVSRMQRLLRSGGHEPRVKAHSEALWSKSEKGTVTVWLGEAGDLKANTAGQRSTTTLPKPN